MTAPKDTRRWLVAYLSPEWPEPHADLSAPFDFGNGARLERIAAWMRSHVLQASLGAVDRVAVVDPRNRLVVSIPYDAAEDDEGVGAQSILATTETMLWLARPSVSVIRLRLYLQPASSDTEAEAWSPEFAGSHPRLWVHPRDVGTRLTTADLECAHALIVAHDALPKRSAVRIAVSVLFDALHQHSWVHRYLLLWIALEGLFGAKAGGEVMFNLSYRLALFLKGPGTEARAVFRRAKSDYGIRSAIVHGMREKEIRDSHEVMGFAETWVREALLKILLTPGLVEKFSKNDERDLWLEELIFAVHD